jgi:hypothetical protein
MKICSVCKRVLSGDCFHAHKKAKDGLRGECKECIKEYNQKAYTKNKGTQQFLQTQHRYYQEHADVVKERSRIWRRENHSRWRATESKRLREITQGTRGRLMQLRYSLRTIGNAIRRRGTKKDGPTLSLLGCVSWAEFDSWMGPRPQGAHLDHICPCSQARDAAELLLLQHHWNLRWLPSKENIQKGNKRTDEGEELCEILLGRPFH